jgi:hypothetical protein
MGWYTKRSEAMISIGAHHGGPELRGTRIEVAITAAMRAAIELDESIDEGTVPALNVVFCTPGSVVGKPDWDHGRVAKYSPKSKLVLVQIAVPNDVVHSGTALDFVIGELHGANALAFEFYRQKKMDFPLAEAERLVMEIAKFAANDFQATTSDSPTPRSTPSLN